MTIIKTMELTGFQQVGVFHETFGHPKKDQLQHDIFKNDPKLVKFRLSLIEEEIDELYEGWRYDDFHEMIDAICDTLFVVYGMCHVFGINYDNYKIHKIESTDKFVPKNTDADMAHPVLTKFLKNLSKSLNALKKSCDDADMIGTINNLNAITDHCYDMGKFLNIDVDQCFYEVFRSNMTKVCDNEKTAKESVDWYVKNDCRYKQPSYKKSPNNKYWMIYDGATSKILKSIEFEHPNFEKFFDK